jgi:hypothetical protein
MRPPPLPFFHPWFNTGCLKVEVIVIFKKKKNRVLKKTLECKRAELSEVQRIIEGTRQHSSLRQYAGR